MLTQGFVVWFTGLPSAGKTTLARGLEAELCRLGRRVEVLDGDEVRQRLTRGLGFSKEDREENIRRIAYVARLLARQGVVAITAAISPYRSGREEARREIEGFVEVYVKCSLRTCITRDVKGLYRRALAGEVTNFTGVSDPYEEPVAPEMTVETDREDPPTSVARIVRRLEELGYLGEGSPEAVVHVPLPAYLVDTLNTRLQREGSDTARYLARVLSEATYRGEPISLSAAERARIEARLADLGYIER